MSTRTKAVPTTIGKHIDDLVKLDALMADLMHKVTALKTMRNDLETKLMETFTLAGISSAKGKSAVAYISHTRLATVKDWAAFEAYVYKHKAFDLFQRRITNTAYFDRTEAGEKVPGVEVFERVDLRLKANREVPKP